jgi:Cellulase (glycosyl hydrolase family 5)/Fibronectin type III domain
MANKLSLVAIANVFLLACGGATPTGLVAANDVSVQVQPTSATTGTNGTVAFAAVVTGTASTAVTWAVQEGTAGGSITSTGGYTASATAGTYHVLVTSQADPTKSAIATVTVTAAATVPAAPSNLVATATSASGIALTWVNNATNQTGFTVSRSSTSATAGFAQIASVSSNVTGYNDSGLAASTAYWYQVVAVNGAGNSAASNSATATTLAAATGAGARPSYNTGTGFFVGADGKLYSPNKGDASHGTEFIPRGFDLLHYDQAWVGNTSGIVNSKANAVRLFAQDMNSVATTIKNLVTELNGIKLLVIPVVNYVPDAPTARNSSDFNTYDGFDTDTQMLVSATTRWVNAYATFAPVQQYMMLNIANEWGYDASSQYEVSAGWAAAYKVAITSLRNAGYTCPLVIDCGSSGTAIHSIIDYGAQLQAFDPQHNIVMSYHAYGVSPSSFTANLAAARTASAAGAFPFIIGEFGPSGTNGNTITTASLIQQANAASTGFPNGTGWLAWAYDDSAPFNMTNPGQSGIGPQTLPAAGVTSFSASDLSTYGNDVIFTYPDGLYFQNPPKASAF